MLSVSSRIWTRVAVFISYDDNHYTTGTSRPLYYTKTNFLFDSFEVMINLLNDILRKNLIDKETSKILKPNDAKPARFYKLPKIHKMNNLGGSVIFLIDCRSTKLSKYVNHYSLPLAQKVKTYKRDTTDPLNKINDIKTMPQNVILVTMNFRSLYSYTQAQRGTFSFEGIPQQENVKKSLLQKK